MQDIAGCRVIVKGLEEQDALVYAAEVLLGDVEIDDKRSVASSAYRAVHVIARVDQKLVEIQIRTLAQHFWAEFSEKLADLHGQDVKYGGGPPVIRDSLDNISRLITKFETLHAQLTKLKLQMIQRRRTPAIKQIKQEIKQLEASIDRIIFDINREMMKAGSYEVKK